MYSVSEARVDANDKNKKVEVKQLATAIEISRLSGDGVPGLSGCAVNLAGSTGTFYNENSTQYEQAMQELVDNGYYLEIPKSPNGKDYFYGIDEEGNGIFMAVTDSNSELSKNNGCFFQMKIMDVLVVMVKLTKKLYDRTTQKENPDELEDCETGNSYDDVG